MWQDNRAGRCIAVTAMGVAVALGAAACSSSMSPSNAGPVGGHSSTIVASGTSSMGNPGGGGGYGDGMVRPFGSGEFFFSPSPDTVAAGTTVTFQFGNVAHTVTFDTDGSPANISSLALGGVMEGDSSRTFPTAGTYTYHCSIHTYMMGTVVVQ